MAAKQTKSQSENGSGKKNNSRSTAARQTHNGKYSSYDRMESKDRKPRDSEVSDGVYDEVIMVITLLVSLLLILSYVNLCGPIGRGINYIMFGFIGCLAYLFPFALFFMVAFTIANRGSKLAKRKLYSGIGLTFVLAAIVQLISGYDPELSVLRYFTESAKHKNGGGILGGILVKPLCSLFGTIATVVILIALLIICVMLITGRALISYLTALGGETIKQHRAEKERYAEEYEQYEMDAADLTERRRPRVVSLQKPNSVNKTGNTDGEMGAEEAGQVQEKKEASFLDKLKQKGNDLKNDESRKNDKKISEPVQNDSYDMKEIVEDKPAEFSITGDYHIDDSMLKDVNEIYEDELKRKFGEGMAEPSPQEISGYETENMSTRPESEHYEVRKDAEYVIPDTERSTYGAGASSAVNPASGEAVTPRERTGESATKHENVQKKADSSTEEPLNINQVIEEKKYEFPSLDLLGKPKPGQKGMTDKDLKDTAVKLQKTLESFGVRVTITNVSCGPAVTRYELQPEQGVKVSKITGLADDIKLNLAAADVRIEAPIPGKAAVGIEVPNKENSPVMLRELLASKEFKEHPSDIAFAVGKDIGGQAVVTDIAKMPHLLIAGATGSGKSVCINTLIMSILYKANPADVRMIMVDPKVVELSVYNGIPHLLIPVVTDPKKASAALNWAVMEMTDRYKKFADLGVRDLKGYNEKVAEIKELNDPNYQKLPQIVIIVDELADLMMVTPGEVEDAICRLAQMARAAGLHLIIATQRPSVNVITGLIKANVPSRIAFSVSSAIDSRTIIDGSGAEKLLGKGDMLFFPSGYPKPVRVQGAFVSDREVSAVVDFLKEQNSSTSYNEDVTNHITSAGAAMESSGSTGNDRDDYFIEAGKFIIEKDKASIGMLQRVYKIGFNRAARIMDQLADAGVVGPEEGTKPRKVLMSLEEFEQYVDEYV